MEASEDRVDGMAAECVTARMREQDDTRRDIVVRLSSWSCDGNPDSCVFEVVVVMFYGSWCATLGSRTENKLCRFILKATLLNNR